MALKSFLMIIALVLVVVLAAAAPSAKAQLNSTVLQVAVSNLACTLDGVAVTNSSLIQGGLLQVETNNGTTVIGVGTTDSTGSVNITLNSTAGFEEILTEGKLRLVSPLLNACNPEIPTNVTIVSRMEFARIAVDYVLGVTTLAPLFYQVQAIA